MERPIRPSVWLTNTHPLAGRGRACSRLPRSGDNGLRSFKRRTTLATCPFLLLMACYGDCISLGYPAVKLTVVDADTGAPVVLQGAVVTAKSPSIAADSLDTRTYPSNAVSFCCHSGEVALKVRVGGYAQWDSTINVPTSGHCNIPELVTVLVRVRQLVGPAIRG